MKKTFWTYTSNSETYDGKEPEALSLLEIDEDNKALFLGSILLKKVEGKYQFCAFSKDRVLCTVPAEQYADTVEEAMESIESFLTERGVYAKRNETKGQ